jgi:hypothetical protein
VAGWAAGAGYDARDGHVAVVTAVTPTSYTVSEMNYLGEGVVDARTVPWPDPSPGLPAVTPAYHRSHDWPIYVIGALPLVGVLFLLAAELPTRLVGGRWVPLTSSNWLERATSSLRDPLDPAGAGLLAVEPRAGGVLVDAGDARRSCGRHGPPHPQPADRRGRGTRRRRRPGFASAREVRAALDGAESGRIAAISVSLPVMRPRADRSDPPTSAGRSGEEEGGR